MTLPPEIPRLRTVLIVEDNADLRELYGYWLRWEGFDVVHAPDGTVALALLDTCTPDVVLLDLHLVTLDGWSVLQEIADNARTCRIPVVVVTGSPVEQPPTTAVSVLRKPVNQRQLLSAVRAALALNT